MLNFNNISNVIQKLNNRIFNSKKIKINDTILIVGSPRSGTTWLMEILGEIPGYTYIFEPLNPIWYPDSFEIGFQSRTYLTNNSNWPAGKDYFKKIFTGQIANLPIKDNPISDLLYDFSFKRFMNHIFASKLIVKSVNMNRMLPWIVKHFQIRGIFFIIRHPCAVVASQIKTGLCGYRPSSPPYQDIFPTVDNIIDEASKVDWLNSDLINKLKKIKTREEILAASWCLDNYLPLSMSKPHPWSFVIYEKLVKEGKKEIIRLFNDIGIKRVPNAAFHNLKKPSMVMIKEEFKIIKKPEQQLSKWKKLLSEEQINKILKIVADFGLDFYTEYLEPKYDKIDF